MIHPLPILAALAGASAPQALPRDPLLDQVVENVLSQPVGPGTVADLALPPEYVELVAERILQGSFAEHFRLVVTDHDPRAKKDVEASPSPADASEGAAKEPAQPSAGAASAGAPAAGAPPANEPGALARLRLALGPIGMLAFSLALVAIVLGAVALRRGWGRSS